MIAIRGPLKPLFALVVNFFDFGAFLTYIFVAETLHCRDCGTFMPLHSAVFCSLQSFLPRAHGEAYKPTGMASS